MANRLIRDVREVIRRLLNRGISFEANRQYPSIPTIDDSVESHTAALRAMREAIETHERRNPRAALDSFVRLYELEDVLGGFQPGESSVTNIYNTGTNVEFATPEETDAGELETKAIHPFGGAYAYDRLRWPGQHTAGKGTATVTLVPDTGVVVIDGDLSNVFEITLTENVHFDDPINLKSGQTYNILITQDGIGGHEATFGASWSFVNQIDPVLTGTASAVDLLSCQWHASAGKTRAVLLPNYGAGYVVPPVYDIADFQFINLGGGNEVVIGKDQYDPELYFRTIVGGGDISVSTVGDTIAISYSTPEAVDYSAVPFTLWQDTAEFPGLPEARQLTGGANILVDTSDMYDVVISCIAPGIPPEGTVGQFLRKSGENDYEVTWSDPVEGVNILADLEDVDLTGLVDGNALVYDAAYGTWVPGTASGGASALADLTDVDLTGLADGDTLVYDSGTSTWLPGAGSAVAALNDLTDVTITTPATDEVLKYNGSSWVNSTAPAGATTLDGLTDVTITSPVTNDVLSYNGSEWVNDRLGTVYLNDGCEVQRTTDQSITSLTFTAVSFDTEARDDNGYWNVSDPTKLTVPASGWYVITGTLYYGNTSAAYSAVISKNGSGGTVANRLAVANSPVTTTGSPRINVSAVAYLAAGDYVILEAYANANVTVTGGTAPVKFAIHRLGTPTEAPTPYNDGCEVIRAATQSVSATTWTAVAFDTELRDDNSYWTDANASRFTAPATGWYAVSFSASFDTASAQCSLFIGKNGSSSTTANRVAGTLPAAAVGSSRHSLSCITFLTAGDYLLFEVYSSALTNLISSVPARAAIHRLGAAVGTSAEGCMLRRLANAQTVAHATWTAVTWDTEVRDDEGYFSVAANDRVTIPVTGWYAISGTIAWDSTTTNARLVAILVDGDSTNQHGRQHSVGINTPWHTASAVIYLVAGQYVQLAAFQDSGTTRTLNIANGAPKFAIVRIAGFPRGTGGTADNVSFDDTNAALGGTNVQDTLDVLARQLRTSGGHVRAAGARVYRNASAQTVANNTATAVTFDTEALDNETFATLGTNNDRLTVNVAGWYVISATIQWDSSTSGARTAWLQLNGSNAVQYGQSHTPAVASATQSPTAVIYMAAGDYVQLLVYQDSGGTRTLSIANGKPNLSIVRLEGKSDVQDSGMEFVGEATVTGSATSSLTLNGLNLDADEEYHFTIGVSNANASGGIAPSLYLNSDSTLSNYYEQQHVINNTSNSGLRQNTPIGAYIASANGSCIYSTVMPMVRDPDGYVRWSVTGSGNSGTGLLAATFHNIWQTTGVNVTSMTLSTGASNHLDVGTFIRVWRRRRITTTPREKVQAADLVITSNASYQDTDLSFSLVAGTYAVEGYFETSSHATPGMSIELNYSGTVADGRCNRWHNTSSSVFGGSRHTTMPFTIPMSTTTDLSISLAGTVTVSDSGTLKLQAKQNTASGTSVTFRKGSRLMVRRIS